MSERAWVTLATNDSYALGALVLARSLRRVNATGQLVVMVTPGVTASMRETLSTEFDEVTGVNILDSEDSANLALLSRPELGITFTKLHCWRLTQFSKCVFLDADTLVLQNCDELFDRNEFSAAPDVGWPDCFNSGVFVFTPSIDTYTRLLAFAVSSGSFDGGDQGLLNLYFNDWSVSDISRHLPFIYNMVASATYSYLPAFKVFGANVKIVHFIGSEKPWLMYFDSATRVVRAPSGQEHLQELLQAWWDIFRADVHRKLSPEMGGDQSATMIEQAGLAGAFAKMSLEGEKSPDQIGFEEQMRKHAWEQGHIDYMGKDSFDNIMKKIQTSIAQTTAEPEKPKSPSPPKTTEVSQPEPQVPQETAAPVQAPSAPVAPPPSPAAPEAPAATVQKQPSQEADEAQLATERQALEKKLAEQKRIAEQRLQEEKQAAEARAAAEAIAAAQKTVPEPVAPSAPVIAPQAVAPQASAPPPTESTAKSAAPASATAAAPDVPVAPPRRQSKVQEATGGAGGLWRNVGVRVGLGLSCVAVVVFAIYSASASSITSSVEGGALDAREH